MQGAAAFTENNRKCRQPLSSSFLCGYSHICAKAYISSVDYKVVSIAQTPYFAK